jgi:hypothetical protein
MSTSRMDEAVLTIARGAGDDLILLAPPEERHFDPFSAVFAFAAVLAGSYLKGLLGSFHKDAEALGEQTGRRIRDALIGIFRGDEDSVRDQLGPLAAETATALQADPSRATEAADAARMRLVDALVENGLPAERALRLAATVQEEALGGARALS